MSGESPEQLLDAFRAAALSVTKLYKTSAAAQAKSRVDGYQDCLEDLLVFLDKEGLGLGESEGARIRKWATDRIEGRDISQGLDSDDDAEKNEPVSSPEIHRSNSSTQLSSTLPPARNEVTMRETAPAIPPTSAPPVQQSSGASEPTEIVVPTQEVFTFTSSHPYPTETYMNLANLDLSDSRAHDAAARSTTSTPFSRSARQRNANRSGSRAMLGRVAGQKRKVNLAEIFDLGSLGQGNGRDMFGGGGKRSRHA